MWEFLFGWLMTFVMAASTPCTYEDGPAPCYWDGGPVGDPAYVLILEDR